MGNYSDQSNHSNEVNQFSHLHTDLHPEVEVAAPPKFDYTRLRARVDEIIEQGFNDMWLLIDGEEMDVAYEKGLWRDGKAFAMVNGNQISLLGPKFSAVNVLLSVGIALH